MSAKQAQETSGWEDLSAPATEQVVEKTESAPVNSDIPQ
jgi:preprotein translocase subunit SecG